MPVYVPAMTPARVIVSARRIVWIGGRRRVVRRNFERGGPKMRVIRPIKAKREIWRGEREKGGEERRKVSVVQKLVNVAEVRKPIRQAWRRTGEWVTK